MEVSQVLEVQQQQPKQQPRQPNLVPGLEGCQVRCPVSVEYPVLVVCLAWCREWEFLELASSQGQASPK